MLDELELATTCEVVSALDDAVTEANRARLGLLRRIVECDLRRVYRADDCDDIASWLALRLGISRWKADRMVTAAYALDDLPSCAAAFRAGEISLDKLMELARFPSPHQAEELLSWAQSVAPAAIRDRVDREIRIQREETKIADRSRSLSWWWEDPSNLSFWGSLPADQGARFVKAIDRLAEKIDLSPEDHAPGTDEDTRIEARRADALVMMASAAIASDRDPDRATVVVHADLSGLLTGDRNAVLADGHPVAPEIASMLTCDARIQTVLHDDGNVIAVGSPSRIAPGGIRRQVEHRDGHRCTFPNCDRKRFVQAHHVVPWPAGKTEVQNLTLLCPTHHRLIHVHGWHVLLEKNGTTRWFRPDWEPYKPRTAPTGPSP